MKKYILGGGINGLIYAFYNPEYTIISDSFGGKLNNSSLKNTIVVHDTPETQKLLNDLGIKIITKTHLIKYVKEGKMFSEISLEDKKQLIKKKMGDEDFEIRDLNLSTNDCYIKVIDVDLDVIIAKLKGRVKNMLLESVIRITESEIITEHTTYAYDEIVSTLPANVFWKLYEKKDNNINLKFKPITFVMTEKIPKVLNNQLFDLVYFSGDEKYSRITKRDNLYLYEFTGYYTEEEMSKEFKDVKLMKYFTYDNGIIFSDKNNIPPKNIRFVGRFATWNHSDKLQDTIKEAIWNFDFRNLWNLQQSFSKNFFDFNNLDEKAQQQHTHKILLHLIAELAEIIECTNFKLHKKPKDIDVEKIKEELIDAQKYLLNLFLIWNVDVQEFVQLFIKKSKIVEERWKKENE